ncbi:PE-PGRS protein, putative [Trichomonas vaginalis G3]|uniref:receptor protein-tyrosine kinase n=1 Tax=Trichomonas vaginalis (strain ATCC PRA-98 / G3) TaxID=412133 RepID=A2FSL1_TRIV3|nr:glycine-rich protein family [Trichomonas vaginalis G3]EAX92112.1 PE-PGRS protein, putative [Trichomonas vaginalis G3]KAI5548636.1 glycine-rich protein family [Trichomonas vaginalis G3]|eukprot:XP_001305042.1 PE-PGRS protein [Trichomonas vaginalis G3]
MVEDLIRKAGAIRNHAQVVGSTFITFENNISNIIIVSGSGGGSGYYAYTDGTVESFGGYGGLIAGNGAGSGFGTGATISSAGNGGFYPGTSASLSCLAENGEKLTGGNSCSTSEASAGGGGSGYFGGGGGADLGGGGGGSSFASDILENIKYLNGNENMTEPIGTTNIGHVGNGFVIIEHFLFCSFGINKCIFNLNSILLFIFVLV